MRDGDTMSEIDRWAQQLQAQREHKAKYPGRPGAPISLTGSRRFPKRTTEPVTPVQAELRCIHHWVCEAPCGEDIHGRCKHCGEERVFDAHADRAEREARSKVGQRGGWNSSIARRTTK